MKEVGSASGKLEKNYASIQRENQSSSGRRVLKGKKGGGGRLHVDQKLEGGLLHLRSQSGGQGNFSTYQKKYRLRERSEYDQGRPSSIVGDGERGRNLFKGKKGGS